MKTTTGRITSKGQVTIPAWVRKSLDIKTNMDIVWLELKPGEISVMKKNKLPKNSIDHLCGILNGKGIDNIDLVESLLKDRKKDLELEERPYK